MSIFKANSLEYQALINNPKINRVLLLDSKNKVIVISLLQLVVNLKTWELALHRLLEIYYSQTVIVKLDKNSIKNIIILAVINGLVDGLKTIPTYKTREKITEIDIQIGARLIQVLLIMSLAREYSII